MCVFVGRPLKRKTGTCVFFRVGLKTLFVASLYERPLVDDNACLLGGVPVTGQEKQFAPFRSAFLILFKRTGMDRVTVHNAAGVVSAVRKAVVRRSVRREAVRVGVVERRAW